MNLETIMEMWASDSKIDVTNLAKESLNTLELHNRYYQIYVKEKLKLRVLEIEAKRIYHDRYYYYLRGNQEAGDNIWQPEWPKQFPGTIINMPLSHDPILVEAEDKVAIQKEKVEFLSSIIKAINIRNFSIKNAIDFMKFQNGS